MLPGLALLLLLGQVALRKAFASAQEAQRARQMVSDWARSGCFGQVETGALQRRVGLLLEETLPGADAPMWGAHRSRQEERNTGLLPGPEAMVGLPG
jgi:hypothetical protein